MTASDFDIYQTESGYVAVTNEVRRQILAALAKKERQLPEIAKLTKKAKPTLSSVHMRELLDQKLIEEVPHPTDKRKKIFRLIGRRIGSSNLPVDQLRSAVRQYMSGATQATRVPLAAGLEAIAAGPAAESCRKQARRLGAIAQGAFPAGPPREAAQTLGGALEREGLARPLRIDLEELAVELELLAPWSNEVPEDRAALLLAALVEGASAGKLQVDGKEAGTKRVVLRLKEA